MGQILAHGRVGIATLGAVVLIAGAYALARGVETPPIAQASAETALLGAIASKDSDTDGLYDWEEGLYGTDPYIYDSRKLGMSDGQAVKGGLIVPKAIVEVPELQTEDSSSKSPYSSAEGSLTSAFSKNLFMLYVEAKNARNGEALTQEEADAIIDQALNDLSRSILPAPAFKTAGDLLVERDGDLAAFAAAAEEVMRFNKVQATTTETAYLARALEGDAAAVAALESIAKGYRTTAAGLSALAVPEKLVAADLAFINALMRVGEIIGDFARVQADPLATMLALHQYPYAVEALISSISAIDGAYADAGVRLSSDEPGFAFAHLAAIVFQKNP